MATRVKVRQNFQQAASATFQGALESVLCAPIMRTITRSDAGQYDTTDSVMSKYVFPDVPSIDTPHYRWYSHVYGDPAFLNAVHPDLTIDGENHLNTLIDNIGTINRFREDKDDNPDLDGTVGPTGQINLFHPNVMPASVVIAKKHTTTGTLTAGSTTGGGAHLWIPTNGGVAGTWPTVVGGSEFADGIVDGTLVVKNSAGDVTYQEGSDWTLEYAWGGQNPYTTAANPTDDATASDTWWLLRFPAGSAITNGTGLELTFEGKFPFTYQVGGQVEPDYVNGSLTLNIGGTIDDPIVYYGFWPQVGVAAFLRERLTNNITQLDFQDFTIKDDAGTTKVWLRPGLQGPIYNGQALSLVSTNKFTGYACGTKTETPGLTGLFDVGGPCGNIPVCNTLHICVYDECGSVIDREIVITSGNQTAAFIASQINDSDINDWIYAYVDSAGHVCLSLQDPNDPQGAPSAVQDARGADCWIEVKPHANDLAPMLGFSNGIIACGRTTYNVREAGTPQFQVRQDNFGNILGSVIVDQNENRYRVNRVVSDNELIVEQVNQDCKVECGFCPTEIVHSATTPAPSAYTWDLHYCDYSADLLLTFTAFRGDLGDSVLEIENGGQDLLSKLSPDGTQDEFSFGPDNPGAYALSKFVFTNGTRKQLFLPVQGYDELAYATAREALELTARPHLIAPMTFDEDAIATISAHVQEMSDPDETYEPTTRMQISSSLVMNGEFVPDTVNDGAAVRFNANPASYARTSDAIDPAEAPNTSGKAKVFVLTDGNTITTNFVSDGVQVGDIVRIHNGINAGDWKVLSVNTDFDNDESTAFELTCQAIEEDQYFIAVDTDHADLTALQGAGDIASMTGQDNLVSYTVYRTFTKSEHVAEIKGIATSLRGATWAYRNIKTWCPLYVDDDTPDGRSATLPGYFLNAAMCGAANLAPVQQGFTNYPLNGASDLRYVKGWFTEKQLQEIEDQGVWIWTTQPGQNSFSAREQFTVQGYNPADTLASQFSIIRVADKMHRRFYNALIGFTGIYNITAENLSVFRSVVEASLRAAKEATAPRVGGEIKNGFVLDIRCDPDNPRTVLLTTRIIPNEPVDVFDITNHIRRG